MAFLILTVSFAVHPGPVAAEETLGGMEKIADNSGFALYLAPANLNFALYSKADDNYYYACPPDLSADTKASGNTVNLLKSLVRVSYIDKDFNLLEMDSYTESVLKNQFSIEKTKNGCVINMTLGKEQQDLYPKVLSVKRYKWITENVKSPADKEKLALYYKLCSLNSNADESLKKIWQKNYPKIKNEDLYVSIDLNAREKKTVDKILSDAGYTAEMLTEDNTYLSSENAVEAAAYFKIPLKLTLSENGLNLSVDCAKLTYDKANFKIVKLVALEYFGAVHKNDGGYIFYPDGSGALIKFNGDTVKNNQFISAKVYGSDISVSKQGTPAKRENLNIPVFGVMGSGGGILTVIEKGDALAEITAEMGNHVHDWYTAFAGFTIASSDTFNFDDVSQQKGWTIVDKNTYTGTISVNYISLPAGSTYATMAKEFRQYLTGKKILKTPLKNSSRLFVDLLGSVYTTEKLLFFPVKKAQALTSFEDAKEIAGYFKDSGIKGLTVNYKGWANGGLSAGSLASLKTESVLGGKRGLKSFSDFMQKSGYSLFCEADFMFIGNDKSFDGFSTKDSAVMLDKRLSGYMPYDPATNLADSKKFMYAVSPAKLSGQFTAFEKGFQKLSVPGITVKSAGRYLYSDFNGKRKVNIEQSKEYIEKLLESASGYRLMCENGNFYTYPYVTDIIDMPITGSNFEIYDEMVPFLQITLCGYINYSTTPLNLTPDMQQAFLKCIETGSALHFTLARRDTHKLNQAGIYEYYAVDYDDFKDDIVSMYKRADALYGKTQNSTIKDHVRIAPDVYRVTYSNGVTVTVNYSANEYVSGEETVPAKDFIVRNGG